ncbi:transglycosylase domain-containing protein [Kitasatospora sp. NBC_01287]|uniref:transglycosylase domain-containing protein n=1 Tax=Kitasatospora sp. NBC_01287 TaxID=2903573 RepID=UPI002252C5AD|nr:transglycosylase domain-containing protein [Kitasatospora sp. NBC_01287]MCX4748825.1 transglycosylase domain-containing protein [Kitasatospora sp. NBC_01287]
MPRTAPRSLPRRVLHSGRPRRTGWRRLVPTWRFALFSGAAAVLLGVGLFALGVLLVRVPDAHAAATAQRNTWLYRDGSVLAQTGQTNRQSVTLDQVSTEAQHAVLAAEDRGFYREGAVNPAALLRAGWNTATGKGAQGGSTITQQYVKNAYLTQSQTISRKAKEIFIALKVDATLSKQEILANYLNTTYYGRGAYGIQAAAQAYFGVDAAKLDATQGAYLATLLNAPSAYDLSTATAAGKRAATARWNYVLDGMVKEGWLPAADRADLTLPQVRAPQPALGLTGQAGYLVDAAKDYLVAHQLVDEAALAKGGYRITLSIDRDRQSQLQGAVQQQLTDQLDSDQRSADADVQTGAVSLDPKSGAVLAMYGGEDYTAHFVNNATRRDYQAGSTFKPIALAAALESGAKTQDGRAITPDTVYDGANRRPVQGGTANPPYAPPNEGEREYGRITLRQATDWSVNTAFAQLAQDTGLEKVKQSAIALGLPADTNELDPVPSLPLGVSMPSVLDLAGVYATLDNDGQRISPWLVQAVQLDGAKVPLPPRQSGQGVSPQTARQVTDMLRGVVADQGGTGWRAQDLGRPAAGKTGTTDGNRSAWFVGYTPELVTSVAMFGEQAGTGKQVTLSGAAGGGRVNGGGYPAQIWTDYMKAALQGAPVRDFTAPGGALPPQEAAGTPGPSAPRTPHPRAPGHGRPAAPGPAHPSAPHTPATQGSPAAPPAGPASPTHPAVPPTPPPARPTTSTPVEPATPARPTPTPPTPPTPSPPTPSQPAPPVRPDASPPVPATAG